MMCEKCWGDAFARMLTRGNDQAFHYAQLLDERRDHPCSPEEQRGEGAEEVAHGDVGTQ